MPVTGFTFPGFSDLRRGDSRGISLIESMTVIVVILILATVATPVFRTMIVRGREAVLREDLFTLRTQIDRFTHDNARGPERLEELVEKDYMGSVPTDPFTGSNQTWQVETQAANLSIDDSAPQGISRESGESETVCPAFPSSNPATIPSSLRSFQPISPVKRGKLLHFLRATLPRWIIGSLAANDQGKN